MMEEMNDIIVIDPEMPDPIVVKAEKKAMRRGFSRCGCAVLLLTVSTFIVAYFAESLINWIYYYNGTDLTGFYNKNLLYVNEIIITLSMAIGAIVLIGMKKSAPAKNKMSAKTFFAVITICFFISWVGNIIGNTLITFWNGSTGNSVTNELAEILANVDILQIIVCTVIFAPILEELFFRKLLIDRMYKFGEFPAIIVSGILFGLFHQNFSQFFYAFGGGVVLAYLYCKTGSYLLTVVLHAIFNFISGAIPSMILTSVLEFSEKLTALGNAESIEPMVALVSEYAVPLIVYFAYLMLTMALNITGLVLFIKNIKRVVIAPSGSILSRDEIRKAIFLNVGMLVSIILLTVLMITTLFTT